MGRLGVGIMVSFIAVVGLLSAVLIITRSLTAPIPRVERIDPVFPFFETNDLDCSAFVEGELVNDYAKIQVSYPSDLVTPIIEEEYCNFDFDYQGAKLIISLSPEVPEKFSLGNSPVGIDDEEKVYRPLFDYDEKMLDKELQQYYFQYGSIETDLNDCGTQDSSCGMSPEYGGLRVDIIATVPKEKQNGQVENTLTVFDAIVKRIDGHLVVEN